LLKKSNKVDNNDESNSSNNIFINTVSSAPVNEAGYSSEKVIYSLQKPRYAILVLDMLNDFVYGRLKCKGAEKIVPNISALVDAARQKAIPVFYCIDQHLPGDIYELKLWGYHAMKGTEGAEIIKELKPSSKDYIIQKRTYSAFDRTRLDRALKAVYDGKGVNTVIITGLTTDICSRHTAYDAFTRGFNIVVAEDGTTAFTEEDHISGLKYMQRDYGVQIRKIPDIIKSLEAIKEDNNNLKQLSFRLSKSEGKKDEEISFLEKCHYV
jgi:nicotinamidase-related amidase